MAKEDKQKAKKNPKVEKDLEVSKKASQKKSHKPSKALTMRDRMQGKTVAPSSITKSIKHKLNKDTEKALKQKTMLQSFAWGFMLPLRWILKLLGWILWPLWWLLIHIVPPYFKNAFKELKFVTWPTTRQTSSLTFAVIMFSVVFGAIIAGVDFGLDKLFKLFILK